MAIIIDINTELKLKSLKKINSSSLKINASQVHKIHKQISEITAIILFEYRGRDKMFCENFSI